MKQYFVLLLLFTGPISFGLTWAPDRAGSDPRFRYCQYFAHSNDVDGTGTACNVDRQSDDKYGRGISHISADLDEGDIIAYQDGTWYVDGTEVGDGSPPRVRYMQVDTIQLVWTHDCEHGVINGFDLVVAGDDGAPFGAVGLGSHFISKEENYVQVGPEQVLARIPTILLDKKECNDDIREEITWSCQANFNPGEEIMKS